MDFFDHQQAVVPALLMKVLQRLANFLQDLCRLRQSQLVLGGVGFEIQSSVCLAEQDLTVTDLVSSAKCFTAWDADIALGGVRFDLLPYGRFHLAWNEFDPQEPPLWVAADERPSGLPRSEFVQQYDIAQSKSGGSTK